MNPTAVSLAALGVVLLVLAAGQLVFSLLPKRAIEAWPEVRVGRLRLDAEGSRRLAFWLAVLDGSVGGLLLVVGGTWLQAGDGPSSPGAVLAVAGGFVVLAGMMGLSYARLPDRVLATAPLMGRSTDHAQARRSSFVGASVAIGIGTVLACIGLALILASG